MRKQTLAGVCIFIAFAIAFGLRLLAFTLDVRVPRIPFVSTFVISFILAPLLYIPLTTLNQRLLAWRKARGRDIEEEEKYENVDAGIISLKPVEREEKDPFGRLWK